MQLNQKKVALIEVEKVTHNVIPALCGVKKV